MKTTYIGAAYKTAGRQGAKIDLIALHWMAGTLASTRATFLGGQRQASAHYGVEESNIDVYVSEADTAWSLGNWAANIRSINIEISAQPGRDASPATIATVIDLIVDICRRRGLTAAAIGKHRDYSATQCPGTIPVEAIRAAVAAKLAPKPATAPAQPRTFPDDQIHWVVEPGDTLSKIAGYYNGPTVAQIAAHNNIDPNRITPGQKIWIPGPLVWIIEAPDTIRSIAAYYGLDAGYLARRNGLSGPDAEIYIGNTLSIA